MSDNGQHNILQEWQEATRRTMQAQVGDKTLTIVYEVVDVMTLLMEGDASNPILAAMQASMMGGGAKAVDTTDPVVFTKLVEAVDKAAIQSIVEPPLIEQGHEVGISVSRIPFAAKMEIFSDLTGIAGGQVSALQTFRSGQEKSLAPRPTSKTVRSKSS